MKMVHLKRTAADKKAEKSRFNGKIGGEDFPYGTRVRLDHETLDKLGINSLPKVGSKMNMHALAHVLSTSEDHGEDGQKRRHMELQLHRMGLEPHNRSDEQIDIDAKQGAKKAMDKALDLADNGENE